MRQVVAPIPFVQKILGAQRSAGGAPYRLSVHTMRVDRPEGVLLCHTLTGELLLLTREEAEALKRLPGPVPPALGELVPRWFLRPEDSDDMALADQVRDIAARFTKKSTALTKYTIFTTMDCNARCFYCFETGWEKSSMTEDTARAAAAYIAAHCGGQPVRLRWFGGEPLVNVRAIDVITDGLREQGVTFYSTMISNGYLFDQALVRRARDVWDLEQVQITLDGTEAVYNERKAYVHPAGSPFQRVLENIGLLLDAGVRVKVRLNMDEDNEQDLYALVDQLAARFGGRSGFGVCLMPLWESTERKPHRHTAEERGCHAEKLRALRAYIEAKGVAIRESLNRKFTVNGCVADSDSYTLITPDGRLSRCSACRDSSIWGSIWSEERDEAVLRRWKERKPPEPACRTCPVYPQCIRIKDCPNWLELCSPIEQSYREEKLRRAILGAYEEWKAAGQS